MISAWLLECFTAGPSYYLCLNDGLIDLTIDPHKAIKFSCKEHGETILDLLSQIDDDLKDQLNKFRVIEHGFYE